MGDLVLPVDKPPGITSFGVIRRLRGILRVKKIGHAGTLDPMATGLLICLVGREATRRADLFQAQHKLYTGTIRLGQTTASYDAETDVIEERDASAVTPDQVERAAAAFVGEIEQVPPVYSAIKKDGERLYKKARRGEEVDVPPRHVTVFFFDVDAQNLPDVGFEAACTKGTYVRSLAHDLGQALGVGGHLTRLRREAIGDLNVASAWTLEALEEAVASRHDD
jgi:tRNA pseudouridine55 synthase